MTKTISNYLRLMDHSAALKAIGAAALASIATDCIGKDLDDLFEEVEVNGADLSSAVSNEATRQLIEHYSKTLLSDNPKNLRYDSGNVSAERVKSDKGLTWRISSRLNNETLSHVVHGLVLDELGMEYLVTVLNTVERNAYNAGLDAGGK